MLNNIVGLSFRIQALILLSQLWIETHVGCSEVALYSQDTVKDKDAKSLDRVEGKYPSSTHQLQITNCQT